MGLMSQAASLTAARLAAKTLAFGASVLVARYLGRGGYGTYSIILSLTLIFSYLSDFGLVSLVIRQVAGSPSSAAQVLGNAVGAQMMLVVPVIAGLIVCGFALELSSTVRIGLVLAGAGLMFESLGRPFGAIITGQRRIGTTSLIIATASIANTLLLLGAIMVRAPLLGLVGVAIPVGVLALALPAALCLRFHGRPSRPRLSNCFVLLRASAPFAILMASAVLYDRVDILILARLAGTGAAGVFAGADRVIDGLIIFPASVGTALYPALAANPQAAARLTWRTVTRVAPITSLLVIACATLAAPLIGTLYGSQYAGIEDVFRILSPLIILQTVAIPLAYLMQARARIIVAVAATLIGLAVDITLNLVLVPPYSYRGSAVSATVAEACVVVVLLLASRGRGSAAPVTAGTSLIAALDVPS